MKRNNSTLGTPVNPTQVAELPETLHPNFRGWAMRNHKTLSNIYTCCTFVVIVTCVVALATPGWYISHERSGASSSTSQFGVVRTADFAFSVLGLSINIEYCVAEGPSEGDCTTAVDQMRFFDDSKNGHGTVWRTVANGQFDSEASDCDGTGSMLLSCGIASLVFTIVAWILVMATRCSVKAFNWCVMAPAVGFVFVAAILMTATTIRFVLALDSLAYDLEQRSDGYIGLVEQTYPSFDPGYGLWLAVCGIFLMWVTVVLMFFIIPPTSSAAALAALAVSQERKDRDKRIKQYGHFVVSGESSLSLEAPKALEDIGETCSQVDRSQARKVGWSRGISALPHSNFSGESIKQDLEPGLARTGGKQAARRENRRSSLPDAQLRNMKAAPWLMPLGTEGPRRSSVPVNMGSPKAAPTIPGMISDEIRAKGRPRSESTNLERNPFSQIDPAILAANARHEVPQAKQARES